MKVAVAVPPLEDFYTTPHRLTFLGARKAASLLHNAGHEAALFFFPLLEKHTVPLPYHLKYLKPFLLQDESGPVSYFSKRWRFGPDYRRCAELILAQSPEIVMISLFAFCYGYGAVRLAEELSKRSRIPIILGGSGAASYPGYFQRTGLFYMVHTGPVEELETDYFNLIQPEQLVCSGTAPKRKGNSALSLTISRGCPKQCSFCSNFISQGRKLRMASSDDVRKEVESFRTDKPIRINFEDDNVLLKKKAFFEILEELNRIFPLAEYYAENGLDYTLLSDDTLEQLINFGFRQFNLSAGSFSEEILSEQKRYPLWNRLSAIEDQLKKKNIFSILYFIVGLSGDTKESLLKNLQQAYRHSSLSGISLFYPVPGITGFEDKSLFDRYHPEVCCGSSAYPWTGSFPTEDLVTAFRLSRFINLLKAPKKESHKDLINKTTQTGKLHSYVSGSLREVPFVNKELAKEVIGALDCN